MFNVAKLKLGEIIVGLAFSKFSSFLPVKKIINNERIIVFYHPRPIYKIHVLIVPKKPIRGLENLKEDDLIFIQEVYRVIPELIIKLSLKDKGYSLIVNGGTRQKIKQLHFHLISS